MWNLHESSPFRACLPFKTFQAATLEEQEHIRLEIGDKVHQVDQIIHVPGVVWIDLCKMKLAKKKLAKQRGQYIAFSNEGLPRTPRSTGHLTA